MDSLSLFKDNNELKDEIKGLGIEYRYSCYREKNPEGCDFLGNFLELFEKDFKQAAEVYKTNCLEYKYGKSCYAYGNYLILGRGIPKDEKEASNVYAKGCDYGFGDACYMSGYTLMGHDKSLKDVIEANPKKGIEEWERGCNGKHANCCKSASNIYFFGKYGVKKNLEKAFEFAFKACELHDIQSCKNVAVMYKKGDGVERDDEKAEFYKKKVMDTLEDLKTDQLYNMELYTNKKSLLQRIKEFFSQGTKVVKTN